MSHQNQNIKKVILITTLRNGSTLPPPEGGGGGLLGMDSMTYNYYSNSNKLSHVDDAVAATNYTTDIDDQAVANYDYDEIGNLIKDNAEGIADNGIVWNVYGKIASITKTVNDITTNIFYTYDANGNRIGKRVHKDDLGITQTWYVRDASGNVMAVYENNNGAVNNGMLTQTEIHLYGSSRLGLWKAEREVQTTNWWMFTTTAMPGTSNGGYTETFTRGKTVFELSNHLGNVLVTVSDRKLQVQSTGNPELVEGYNADVLTANDYYPFGSLMPGRKFSADGLYRYGFNGKENDNDVKGEGNQQDYGMRIYDPRLGKFLSVDPLTKNYPELTPYQFASNRPIDGIDLDGLEYLQHNSKNKYQISLYRLYTYKDDSRNYKLDYDVWKTNLVIHNTIMNHPDNIDTDEKLEDADPPEIETVKKRSSSNRAQARQKSEVKTANAKMSGDIAGGIVELVKFIKKEAYNINNDSEMQYEATSIGALNQADNLVRAASSSAAFPAVLKQAIVQKDLTNYLTDGYLNPNSTLAYNRVIIAWGSLLFGNEKSILTGTYNFSSLELIVTKETTRLLSDRIVTKYREQIVGNPDEKLREAKKLLEKPLDTPPATTVQKDN